MDECLITMFESSYPFPYLCGGWGGGGDSFNKTFPAMRIF